MRIEVEKAYGKLSSGEGYLNDEKIMVNIRNNGEYIVLELDDMQIFIPLEAFFGILQKEEE